MACPSTCDASPPNITANGDIAGIGVLLSFILSALMLVIYVTVYYLTVYNPELHPYQQEDQPQRLCENPNPIDRAFLYITRMIWRFIATKTSLEKTHPLLNSASMVERALTRMARVFSDIQTFTGIAVLISGFKAYSCDLQSYHWQLIIYMAWLAFVTHASVLSSLRSYLLRHRRQMWWRFGGMFVNASMLLVALALTSDLALTGGRHTRLAKCPERNKADAQDALETKLKLGIFLAYGFTIRVFKLFPAFDRSPRRLSYRLRTLSISIEMGRDGRLRWDPRLKGSAMDMIKMRLLDPLVISGCRVLHIHIDLLTSFLGEVFWLLVSFIWATRRLYTVRTALGPEEENEWAFGQIFPIVLLAVPLVTLVNHFAKRQPTQPVILSPSVPEGGEIDEPPGNDESTVSDIQAENTDVNYESSSSFRGASVITAFTYLHIAIFVLAGDNYNRGIAYTIGTLTFSCFVFQPILQATWIIYVLWMPKVGLGPHRIAVVLDMMMLTIFLILATHTSIQISREALNQTDGIKVDIGPIAREALVILALAITYTIFLGWFTLSSAISSLEFGQRKWLRRTCFLSVAAASIIGLALATLPAVVWLYVATERFSTLDEYFLFTPWLAVNLGIALGALVVAEVVEFGIRWKAPGYAPAIRTVFLGLVISGTVASLYSTIATFHAFAPPGLVWTIPIIIGYQTWFTVWMCCDLAFGYRRQEQAGREH